MATRIIRAAIFCRRIISCHSDAIACAAQSCRDCLVNLKYFLPDQYQSSHLYVEHSSLLVVIRRLLWFFDAAFRMRIRSTRFLMALLLFSAVRLTCSVFD